MIGQKESPGENNVIEDLDLVFPPRKILQQAYYVTSSRDALHYINVSQYNYNTIITIIIIQKGDC